VPQRARRSGATSAAQVRRSCIATTPWSSRSRSRRRHYTDDISDPAEIYRNGEDEVTDALFAKQVICSADPQTHVARIKAIARLGADVVVLMNVFGADPHAALRVYGEHVIPKLRRG
jgi:alkanesulfonate monooxygenase SsuD/methylene tetrahydromethanopterin reductase-like flavin-dependent oxidoreductase (luciferase family)